MARVNHKKVKQLIAQKQKTITDRQFFVSRILAAHFADMAAAQTKRYGVKRRVKVNVVWKPRDKCRAVTNNSLIWINAGHPQVTCFKSRPERYDQVCGLFAHELGHVLYTDFLAMQTYHSRQEAGQWYPESPPLRNFSEREAETELWDYAKSDPKHMRILQKVSHEIMNVLEDGYIEQRMLMDYPGVLGSGLQAMRDGDFEAMPTISQIIENEPEQGHIWLTILQVISYYMEWGEIKYGDTPLTDPRIQAVFSMLPELDLALTSRVYKDRCRAANLILVRCWTHIRDFMDLCEKQAAAAGTGVDAADFARQLMEALAGSSAEATGETTPVVVSTSAPGNGGPTAKSRAETAKLAGKDDEEDKSEGDAEKEAAASAGEPPADNEDSEKSDGSPSGNGAEERAGANGGGEANDADGAVLPGGGLVQPNACQAVSAEEGGRIPLQETAQVSAPEGGETTQDDEYAGTGYSNAAHDIERILERIAENDVCTELERQRTKELTELAQSISYGDIHDGVGKTVHRIDEVDDSLKDQYDEVAGELIHISKQLQKSVSQQLKDSRRGGKQTGLLMGRRLDTHALCRRDGRVFCKNALPNDIPALSVGLLLDESGSMYAHDRATYARATAIILYDFCQALGIPIMVYGHSTSSGVDLYSYAEFDAIDRNDCYRMMDISARGSNRDGAALRYVAERLSARPEDMKLLILVSDGQPADDGYYGTAAEEDLRGIKQEYQRKGILFVAAAIGSDKENIERIYGDSFLDITDLNKLPTKLAGVIKRFIRV